MKKWKPAFISRFISNLRRGAAGFGFAAILFACAGTIPEPGDNHLHYAAAHGYSTSLENLREGRALMLRKCDGCHSFPRIKRYAPEKWPAIMDSMRIEAKLSSHQDTLIRNYLMIASGNLRDSLAAVTAAKHSTPQ
ncbi:MAG TPA: hypothetical protein DCQ83_07860 [Fibrobacteres bacterium]|nr:hypothetical protein [Fibrobacterota bacterium]